MIGAQEVKVWKIFQFLVNLLRDCGATIVFEIKSLVEVAPVN